MFSVIFPGQGSQSLGMGKEFFDKFEHVKKLFQEADDVLNVPLSKFILDGPKDKLDLTVNTQPAIFLISFSIFHVIKNEFNIDLHKAKYFAGHSLGEYTALTCSGSLNFSDTLKILKKRGKAMQSAVPNGVGGMLAVLNSNFETINNILVDNKSDFECYIANDNSNSQIVVSGFLNNIDKFSNYLTKLKIRNLKIPVSSPFHCKLMNKATKSMEKEIKKLNFNDPKIPIVSNVTANITKDNLEYSELMIKQIEHRVRWRESIQFMAKNNVKKFVEIGPGKVLSNLIKRIDTNFETLNINSIDHLEEFKL
mgnify:CR=1 FL=1